MKFGTDSYRAGALERVGDATFLLANRRWGGAVYSAGLAVEGMLRSLVWLKDKRLDERHELRWLATRIENLGLLREGSSDEQFVAMIQDVAIRWHNLIRFAANDQLLRWWGEAGLLRKKSTGEFTKNCRQFVDECAEAVQRCEVLWRRHRKDSSRES